MKEDRDKFKKALGRRTTYCNELEKDLFILPSSVHEIIIVPATDDIDRKELDNMVKDVNKKELDAIDVLSDHVYYYSRDRREVCL